MARKEKVTKIIDGDTFLTNRRKIPVCLANVATPELGQREFKTAKDLLSKMILNKEVNVQTVARDKYRRAVANVKVGRNSVNKAVREKSLRKKKK